MDDDRDRDPRVAVVHVVGTVIAASLTLFFILVGLMLWAFSGEW